MQGIVKQQFAVLILMLALPVDGYVQELEGDHLYKVTTIRAAPGSLSALLDWELRLRNSKYFEDAGIEHPLLMRHSQGDQWDLLAVIPMGSWTDHHSSDVTARRKAAHAKHAQLIDEAQDLIAFYEDHFAYGPPWPVVVKAYATSELFHVEMFHAAPGKAHELLEQRHMENAYLAATGQTPNMIFRRAAGSDVDVFTIGFHENLQAFAKPADVTVEQKERAAKAAGFQGLADISFYLRSLISAHHDTLAVKVE